MMNKNSTPHPRASNTTWDVQYNKLDVVKAIAPHLFSCSRRNLRRLRPESVAAPARHQTRKIHIERMNSVHITAVSTQDLAEAVTVLKADIDTIIRGRNLNTSSNRSMTNYEVDVLTARLDKIMADVQGLREDEHKQRGRVRPGQDPRPPVIRASRSAANLRPSPRQSAVAPRE